MGMRNGDKTNVILVKIYDVKRIMVGNGKPFKKHKGYIDKSEVIFIVRRMATGRVHV